METKKNEVVVTTKDPNLMLDKYLSKPLIKMWTVDFADEDTGEVVKVDRQEVLIPSGTLLDAGVMSKVNFYLQSEEVTEVTVSNQKREGIFVEDITMNVWNTMVDVSGNKIRVLLYANSAENAMLITQDFISLTYAGLCSMLSLKNIGSYVLLENLTQVKDEECDTKQYYKIEVSILHDTVDYHQRFVVFAKDVEAAMIVINDWIAKGGIKLDLESEPNFTVSIESANTMACKHIIPKEFSLTYCKEK